MFRNTIHFIKSSEGNIHRKSSGSPGVRVRMRPVVLVEVTNQKGSK